MVTSFVDLKIFTYGRQPVPLPSVRNGISEGIDEILNRLILWRSTEIIRNMEIISGNRCVRVRFSTFGNRLTRGTAEEIIIRVGYLTKAFLPREILHADIMEESGKDPIGQFMLSYPSPCDGYQGKASSRH